MKSALLAASLLAGSVFAGAMATDAAAAPPSAQASAAGAPVVPTLNGLIEKELHWGMSHTEVIDVYNKTGASTIMNTPSSL